MRSIVARLAAVLALVCMLTPSTASAQTPCRFVFGFADLAARLGPETVGACLENQRTITGKESFVLSERITLALPAGTAVQRTTTGVLSWLPQPNLTEFADMNGSWTLTATGVSFKSWDEIMAAFPRPTSTPSTPPATQRTDRDEALLQCSEQWTNALSLSIGLGMSRPEMERRKAEADAIKVLCDAAATSHGTRGVRCFNKAWEAAASMERVFPGSGRKAYDDAYALCISSP